MTSFSDSKRNVEFFRGDLLKGGLEALAELGLAGEDRDAAVGIDADPGIEIGRALQAAGQLWRRAGGGRVPARLARRRRPSEKLTTSAPPPASTRRRVEMTESVHGVLLWPVDASAVCISWRRDAPRAGSAYACRSGRDSARASARISRVGRLGIPLQQRLRPHHHAGDAVAALRRLLLDEGALDRRRRLDGAEAFQRW